MNIKIYLKVFLLLIGFISKAQTTKFNKAIIDENVIFEEKDGLVAVEAEYFYKQNKSEIREWFRTSKNESPSVGRDDDKPHCKGASNNAYIEILPDERVTHSDKLIHGDNFTNKPGTMAIVHYKVKINTPGKYFVWVRAFSTGGEDNGIHVGLNGTWPEHGQRMQWCKGKNQWTWDSKQRTKEVHCGVPYKIYLDIDKTGIHDIQFSMREDGFEMDKFILTNDKNYVPTKLGPQVIIASGELPPPFPVVEALVKESSYFNTISKSITENKSIASQEFPIEGTNFYKNGKNWLAINPEEHKEAKTTTTFNFDSGNYDIIFVGVGENDGQSIFTFLVNNKQIGKYMPKRTQNLWEEGKDFNGFWKNIKLNKGDKISVIAKVASDGEEWTRGRWAGIVFTPVGKGEKVQEAPSTSTFVK